MKKLFAWMLGMTKVGKAVKQAQGFLDGKKQMLASLAAAVPATLLILQRFTDEGLTYLTTVASTPEFLAASGGWVAFFNALKGEKIRHENAEIITKLDANTAITQQVADKK